MASAINQLIAQQQQPDVIGSVGRAAQTLAAMEAVKGAPIERQMRQQQLDMGRKQLAALDEQSVTAKRAQGMQMAANAALAIDQAKTSEQKAQIYSEVRRQAEMSGHDVSPWPAQYSEQVQSMLDFAKQQVYGAEQFKTDEAIRQDRSKAKGPQSQIGKLVADRESAVAAGADPATLASMDAAIDQAAGGLTPYQKKQLALDERRLKWQEQQETNKAPAGYQWTQDGKQTFIPGGPADPAVGQRNAVPTEAERKAATLLKRLEFSEAQLAKAVEAEPGAAKPELDAEFLRSIPFVGGDAAANVATSEKRQQVEAAQLDLLDAALTLGTGAAYTKEQLRGYAKSYFPQIGDEDATVKEKQDRLQNIIEAARISAGRAAPTAGESKPASQDASPSFKEGATATNPKTGERKIFKGGKWQKL